jgi:hypothetical protein
MMGESWYDTAMICTSGHVVNGAALSYPQLSAPFCDRCGAPALGTCPSCLTPIRGEFHLSGTLAITPYCAPAYCPSCGCPYPWTLARLEAAQELADEMERLTPSERVLLKESIVTLAGDGPASAVAVVRLKRLLAKVGAGAAEAFKQILVDVVSEAVSKAIWGQ